MGRTLPTAEMTEADFHNLRRDMRAAVETLGEKELSWAWFQAMTQANRDAFVDALVRFDHPLAQRASNAWNLFRAYVLEDF